MTAHADRLGVFHCGSEQFDAAVFDAFDPRVGTPIVIPYLFFVVGHGDDVVLFDCGVHPELITDPVGRMGPDVAKWDIRVRPEDAAACLLESAGIAPSSVTHVVLSHLHYDHAGGMNQFAAARKYAQRAELEYARDPDPHQADLYVAADIAPDLIPLDGETDLFGDGSVVIFPTPGHTPGHQSMHVRLSERDAILVGDAAPSEERLRARALPTAALSWNPAEMVRSHALLEERATRSGAQLFCGHDERFRDRMWLAPESWYL